MTGISINQLMQSSGVAFGTSGVRGLVAQMSDELCATYTTAFLKVIKASFDVKRIAVGIDLRPSSPRIAAACAASIVAEGFKVDYCGELPTPALAYYAQQAQIPAIMVTGSHIPFDRNGIKFYRPDGEISKADESAIVDTHLDDLPILENIALPEVNGAVIAAYRQRYLDFFPPNSFAGLRLGLYEHSSVARDVFRQILEALGAEVMSLERTSTFVPIDTEAVGIDDIMRGLRWSDKYGFDAIISTDGDGDRPLISDESGTWLRGDIVGLLACRYLGVKQIAVPVSCNTAIELSEAFDNVTRTRIGSPFVIAGMQQLNPHDGAVAGFEANGGLLLGSEIESAGRILAPLPTRDAALPAIAVLAAAQQRGVKISALLHDLPQRYTASDRIQDFPTALSAQLLATWVNDLAQFSDLLEGECGEISQLDQTDGLRLIFQNNEIIHLRPSGNAPELRCYCEATTPERAEQLNIKVLNVLRQLR